MGPAGLTAVFGMGTGGAPQVSSPEWPRLAVRRAGTESERHAGSVGRGEPRRMTRCQDRSGGTHKQRSKLLKADRSGGSRGDPSLIRRVGRRAVRLIGPTASEPG